ncbi:MAG: dTMP kinase [Planctomycetales bacterium]|nr:dTMP kinase [Planctomycetales bacterium]
MFFSFDGLDGVGKTTQMQLFCQWLAEQKTEVVTCRDPGSTPLGERIREILLLSDEQTPIAACSEMLLYMAARAQLVDEIIRPALEADKTVVSDRYLLANIVYQGHAGGLEPDAVRTVGQVATGGILPDCTFLLDMSPKSAMRRMGDQLDRMESRGDGYRQRLRDGFLAEAERTDGAIHVIDADRPVDVVQAELQAIATPLLAG